MGSCNLRFMYFSMLFINTLLAIIDKYGVSISQRDWLYQALLEVSMKKITLWIHLGVDDWTAEMATIAINLKLILCESIWQQCRFRFRLNINQPLPDIRKYHGAETDCRQGVHGVLLLVRRQEHKLTQIELVLVQLPLVPVGKHRQKIRESAE